MPYLRALENIHFPGDQDQFLKARERIVFEEFYVFFTNMYSLKTGLQKQKNTHPAGVRPETEELIGGLSFTLTQGQTEALDTIRRELAGPGVMHRLLQGDVGSGKTIIAFLAMYEMALNGHQAVLMAPTEVLATQHYQAFCKLMETCEHPVRCALLTGSMSQGQKREAMSQIREHQVDVVLGTHALFQECVEFDDLGLVVVDEQHRFGVEQRQTLMDKGGVPHALFMSATPIPRSLAGVLYADMDVSILAQKPQNRIRIKSCVVGTSFRPNAYSLIRRELDHGHQAYIICSLVEESELMPGENVVDYTEKMKDLFGNTMVGMLHGRMSAQEKQRAMEDFSSGRTKVLVSTTVVEVGVDVPNATVILIEDAQRFGLAQLHQLRGRVGRGAEQSYCIFMDTDDHPEDNERLKVMNASDDGFFIASEDLRLRGPGDLFGVRQSGELSFRLADIYRDGAVMKMAAEEAASNWRNNCEN
jgi:ATP-dependent DNA helicase RecG